jgi:uncharacterized protein YqhQ
VTVASDYNGHWAFSAFHSMMTQVVLLHQRVNNTSFINCQMIVLVSYIKVQVFYFLPLHILAIQSLTSTLTSASPITTTTTLDDPYFQLSPFMTNSWSMDMVEEIEQTFQHSKHGNEVIQY